MSRPEAILQKHIVDRCEDRGAYVVKVHQAGYGRRGVADLLLCFLGYFVALEVKATSKLRPAQKVELEKVRLAGGVRMVVNSIDTAMGVLDQIERLHAKDHGLPPSSPIKALMMGERVIVGHIPTSQVMELDAA